MTRTHGRWVTAVAAMLAGLGAGWPAASALAQNPSAPPQPRSITPPPGAEAPRSLRPPAPGPARFEQPHTIEMDGLVFPSDTRVVSIVGVHLEVNSVTTPSTQVTRVIPGRGRDIRLVISGALPVPADSVAWFDAVRQGTIQRKDAVITLLERDFSALQRIKLSDVLPIGLDADIPNSRWFLTLSAEDIRFETP